MPMATAQEARAEATLMGHAIMVALQRHTRYECEPTGDPSQVRIAVA